MGDRTSIEWTESTWNPIRGTKGSWYCTKVSPGCTYCYAERLNLRRGGPAYKVGADTLRLDMKILTQPLRWKRPRRIFVCSMTDLFHEKVPDEWIAVIASVMFFAQRHTFQVLTKRAKRMQRWLTAFARQESKVDFFLDVMKRYDVLDFRIPDLPLKVWPCPHIWWGVSVEDQKRADERIPSLLQAPGAVRFLSVEPLLGPVDLRRWLGHVPDGDQCSCGFDSMSRVHAKVENPIHWIIVGGESGGPPERALNERCRGCALRRGMSWCAACDGTRYAQKGQALQWVRSLRDQCAEGGVPFFFKQWGGPTPKSGGRFLDGREWNEYPGGHDGTH